MPYIKPEILKLLQVEPGAAKTVGDYNALNTLAMIDAWQKDQSYATIHALRKSVVQPSEVEEMMAVETLLTIKRVTMEDRRAARELAFAEFYRRVGTNYENTKARENGDVYEDTPYANSVAIAPLIVVDEAPAVTFEQIKAVNPILNEEKKDDNHRRVGKSKSR